MATGKNERLDFLSRLVKSIIILLSQKSAGPRTERLEIEIVHIGYHLKRSF